MTKSRHTRQWWLKNCLPLLLGAGILIFLYRDFDLTETLRLLRDGVRYEYLLLSLPFGLAANALRGYRWHLLMRPLYTPPARPVNPVLITIGSYAVNAAVPRAGEVWRCTEMKQREEYKISEVLGSLLVDRVSDLCVVLLMVLALLFMPNQPLTTLLEENGISVGIDASELFSATYRTAWIVGGLSVLVIGASIYGLRHSRPVRRIKEIGGSVLRGAATLRTPRDWAAFLLLTLGIWVCYFYYFYVTFWAFDFTAGLGIEAGFLTFVLSTVMVAVPTPAGIGPWHYAVILSLSSFGIGRDLAGHFALIVHSVQTLWVIVVGIIAIFVLPIINKNYHRTPLKEQDVPN